MIKKVGKRYSDGELKIAEVPCDKEGWVDASKFLPEDYVMCRLELKNGKRKSGWHSGNKWDGLWLNEVDEILFWKKENEAF
jgi:hypothetical protein